MANNQKAYRKLIDLRNKVLLNQISTLEFIKIAETVLFNYASISAVNLAGSARSHGYTRILIRLLSDELGQTESIKNLKVDLLAYDLGFI